MHMRLHLESQLIYYFYVLVAILILFFLDAIREMQKYSAEETQQKTVGMSHLDTQMQMHMRLFRADSNFYIAGFALFLCLVIKRLVGLISANAGLQAEKDAAMKQAESASRAAEMFMKDGGTGESQEGGRCSQKGYEQHEVTERKPCQGVRQVDGGEGQAPEEGERDGGGQEG